MRLALWLALAAAAVASPVPAALASPVPATLSFTARLVDDRLGEVLTGDHHLDFELFAAPDGGAPLWRENRDLWVEDGLVFLALGAARPFGPGVFTGRRLYLEVTLDGTVMDPRISLESVAYAIRASDAENADAVGGIAAQDLQRRVTGTCGPGFFVTVIHPDGTVTCAPDTVGEGDITAVTAGPGLEGGGSAGDVTLSLLRSCAPGQLLKWDGAAWACAADVDTNSGGDITAVAVGAAGGLTGGGSAGDVALSLLTTCAPGQLLKWSGSIWGCANDTDTNSGGDITSVTTATSSGLAGGGSAGDVALSLLTTCAPGQLLKWSGSAWTCADDIDTDTDTNSGGDVTDVIAGAGLVGGGASGSVTLDVAAGDGIAVSANSVALDLPFTDGRYVNTTGDTMTGALDMNNQRLANRGCPTGHIRIGPGLCTESIDQVGFTFTGCANRCRVQGTHMCSSGEFRAILASGVGLVSSALLDWIDDQNGDDSAFYVNNTTTTENPDGTRSTSTSSWCRCCSNVE